MRVVLYRNQSQKSSSASTTIDYVKHPEHLDKIIAAQGTIYNQKKIMLIRATYTGESLREWNNQYLEVPIVDEQHMTDEDLKALRDAHANYFFPKGALAKQP